jgi:membrane-associated phospholipid phosphatase
VALHERIASAAPMSPRERRLGIGLAAALVLVAIGVVLGAFTRFDQFFLDHFMPWLVPGSTGVGGTSGFWKPFQFHTPNGQKILDVLTYPCSVGISGLVVAIAAIVLWPRLGPLAALAPAGAWVVGNAIEVFLKATLVRPPVYGRVEHQRVHVVTFDDSFASGHMLRGIIVAYTVTLLWSGASPVIWVWVALVGPALVVTSAHTPSDVIGGALVGFLVILPVHAIVRQARRERGLAV